MKRRNHGRAIIAVLLLCPFAVVGAGIEPMTVSPGATDRVTGVEVSCPTFSWQALPGAVGYEIVVYELPPRAEVVAWSLDDAVEAIFVRLPAGVTAWTPSLESGLACGADHVWFMRGVLGDIGSDEENATDWSEARFFRVAGEVVETESEMQSRGSRYWPGAGKGVGVEGATSRGMIAEADGPVMATRMGEAKTKDVGTAMAAIRGEMPDPTGETYGVVGTSNSLDGAGLGAVNTANGPDLVLDGVTNGQTDLDLYHWGIDRASPDVETYVMTNSLGGGLDLWVNGEAAAQSFSGNGAALHSVDAETLDGMDSTGFSAASHLHDDRYYTETELNASGGGGSVHWDNLESVPAGLDDGDQDTLYFAGSGLDLTGDVFSSMGSGFGNVVVVAASGGDFTSIQAAIDNITDASAFNPYLVWVAPGSYSGAVVTKPNVHLQGAGQGATIITSNVSSTNNPPDTGTIVLSSDITVRDMTVVNFGSGTRNVSILAPSDVGRIVLSRVTALSNGSGVMNFAVVATGIGTSITLEDVTASADNGTSVNAGLYSVDGPSVMVGGGSFTGFHGDWTYGLLSQGPLSFLVARNVVFVGENGSLYNHGVRNESGAEVYMDGGSSTGRGGATARGVHSFGGSTEVDITNAAILAAEGTDRNDGLAFGDGCAVTVRGGTITGRGGETAAGVYGSFSGWVEMIDVTVRGELATLENYGFQSSGGITAILKGGSFQADGGSFAQGISNDETILTATGVTAIAENGSTFSYGMSNFNGTDATLVGGSFIARGGGAATGIYSFGSGTTIEATGVSAVGDNGTDENFGLRTGVDSEVSFLSGRMIGRGGVIASGIKINDEASVVDAHGSIIIGEGAPSSYGFTMNNGTLRLANSQLVGGINVVSTGTLECHDLYDAGFATYLCPPP